MPAKPLDQKVLDELRQAIESDTSSSLERLIQSGVSVNQKLEIWPRRLTLLEFAIEKNATKTVEALVKAGADFNKGSHKPLIHAALWNRLEILQMLLAAGANPDVAGKDDEGERGLTALMIATDLPEKIEVFKVLLKHGANPHLATNKGNTALAYAVDHGNLAALELLLTAGCKPHGRLLKGPIVRHTPESLKMLKLLVAAGADLHVSDLFSFSTRQPEKPPFPTALELATQWYDNKVSLIQELESRERNESDQQALDRWKSEARILQEMMDELTRAMSTRKR
jgi:ankyrin repeat protein